MIDENDSRPENHDYSRISALDGIKIDSSMNMDIEMAQFSSTVDLIEVWLVKLVAIPKHMIIPRFPSLKPSRD
jgi:hypothetical protein